MPDPEHHEPDVCKEHWGPTKGIEFPSDQKDDVGTFYESPGDPATMLPVDRRI